MGILRRNATAEVRGETRLPSDLSFAVPLLCNTKLPAMCHRVWNSDTVMTRNRKDMNFVSKQHATNIFAEKHIFTRDTLYKQSFN